MTETNCKTEFPRFDGMTFAIPAYFEDRSWHQDAMPSFVSDHYRLQLWANYVDKSLREPGTEDGPRFALHRIDAEGVIIDDEGSAGWPLSPHFGGDPNNRSPAPSEVQRRQGGTTR